MTRFPALACLALAAAALLIGPSAAHAFLAISPDLDTLVNRSTAIVEGEVVEVQGTTLHVRISHVYRGSLQEKDITTFDAASHQKSDDFTVSKRSAAFDIGDQLICFLGPERILPPPYGSEKLRLYGLRLISNGKVADFSQPMSSGPLVAQLGPAYAKDQPTLAEFRKTLEADLQQDDATLTAIQKAATEKNSRKLLAILSDRPSSGRGMAPGEDRLSRAAIDALIALHDYPVLAAALLLKTPRTDLLQAGFYTPAGREFLLQTIADPKIDPAQRLACTSVLPYQGLIENPPGVFDRDPHYVTRLAQLATDNAASPDLCIALAGRVGGLGPPTNPDVLAAMEILTRLYPVTTNESIRYCIERTLRSNSKEAYAALHSPCGPVLSIVKPQTPGQFDKPVGRQFAVLLEWEMDTADDTHALQSELWLQPSTGGPAVHVGPGIPLSARRNQTAWHTQPISIPANLPAGKYRIYFRFSENDQILGQSHSLEFELQPG